MSALTVGQEVVVTDRRDLYAYEEGVIVTSGEPDRHGNVRVHFPTIEGRPQTPGDVRRVWVLALSPLPKIGERRRWSDRAGERARLRGPFVIQSRNDTSEERLFTIYYEATRTHSTASAAELAGFSELIEEHDGGEHGATAESAADTSSPRDGVHMGDFGPVQAQSYSPEAQSSIREFIRVHGGEYDTLSDLLTDWRAVAGTDAWLYAEMPAPLSAPDRRAALLARGATLDTLRDVVLEAALELQEVQRDPHARPSKVAEHSSALWSACDDYRAARDS